MNRVERQSYDSLPDFETTLEKLAQRLSRSKILKGGDITFRLTGPRSGDYFLHCTHNHIRVYRGTPQTTPIIELIGESRRMQSILDGKKDARKHFLAGGFRVRGNLRYASDLALEISILTTPI